MKTLSEKLQEKTQAINTYNYEELTVKEIVFLFSSYRVINNKGLFLRIATEKESNDNANQLQENRNNGIEIAEPLMVLEIAELLVEIDAYKNVFNAIEKVYEIQDRLAAEDDNFMGEKSNTYLAQCMKVHGYLIKTGQKVCETVGSGKWLKEIGLSKSEVMEF